MRVPTDNAIPVGAMGAAQAGPWCSLGLLLVPYGGQLAAQLQLGETLLVSRATGNFGSACVAVALAMGAGCVIAPGRNTTMLAELARRHGPRVRTVQLSGDALDDTRRMQQAAPGGIGVVLDLLPPSAGPQPVRAAAMAVREYGRIVLMGGVGLLGGDDLALPCPAPGSCATTSRCVASGCTRATPPAAWWQWCAPACCGWTLLKSPRLRWATSTKWWRMRRRTAGAFQRAVVPP